LYFDSTAYNTTNGISEDTQTTLTVNTTLTPDNYSVFINCTDETGNEGNSTIINIIIDTAPPTVNINESLNNTVFNTGTPTLDFNFTDNQSGTANCTLYFDTTAVNASNDVSNNSPIDMKVNTSQNDANYSVYINCTDKAGNLGKSGVLNIEIDTGAPIIGGRINWSITDDRAKINWSTDEPANGTVIYGNTTAMSDGSQTHASYLTNHSLTISNLRNATLYYYNITSCDEDQQCNISGPYNFTTAYLLTSPPSGTRFRLESNTSENIVQSGQKGVTEILVGLDSATGNYSGIIAINFTQNINMSELVADTNRTSAISIVHNASSITGYINLSLLIPRIEDMGTVYICPNAISNAQVNTSCSGKVDINTGQTVSGMTVSEVSYDGEPYYEVSNVSGSGGAEGDHKHWISEFNTSGNVSGVWNVSLIAVSNWFYPASLDDTRQFTLGTNNPPSVDTVSSVSPQTPNAENVKKVEVNFTVTDTNGISDLNHSSAKAVFTNSTITREGNCSNNTVDSNTVEYNCSVNMQYYDYAGTWAINVSIMDNSQASAYNATTDFTYGELIYIQVSPTIFGFGDYYPPGPSYQAATSNPLEIDNMGNVNLTEINVTGYNLVNGSYTLGVSNVTVNVTDATGTTLQNANAITIPDAAIYVDVGGVDANESLYFYITIPNVPAIYYNSSSSWVISAGE